MCVDIVLMSLRAAKVLARSPKNTWVFNSSKVISENGMSLTPPGLGRAFGEQEKLDFSFVEVSDGNLMASFSNLDAAHGCSPPLLGQRDMFAWVTLDSYLALNPTIKKGAPSLDNLIADKFDVFIDYGVLVKVLDGSP